MLRVSIIIHERLRALLQPLKLISTTIIPTPLGTILKYRHVMYCMGVGGRGWGGGVGRQRFSKSVTHVMSGEGREFVGVQG